MAANDGATMRDKLSAELVGLGLGCKEGLVSALLQEERTRDRLPQTFFWVPGRVEFAGKHTDYCGGESIVFPISRGFLVGSVVQKNTENESGEDAGDEEVGAVVRVVDCLGQERAAGASAVAKQEDETSFAFAPTSQWPKDSFVVDTAASAGLESGDVDESAGGEDERISVYNSHYDTDSEQEEKCRCAYEATTDDHWRAKRRRARDGDAQELMREKEKQDRRRARRGCGIGNTARTMDETNGHTEGAHEAPAADGADGPSDESDNLNSERDDLAGGGGREDASSFRATTETVPMLVGDDPDEDEDVARFGEGLREEGAGRRTSRSPREHNRSPPEDVDGLAMDDVDRGDALSSGDDFSRGDDDSESRHRRGRDSERAFDSRERRGAADPPRGRSYVEDGRRHFDLHPDSRDKEDFPERSQRKGSRDSRDSGHGRRRRRSDSSWSRASALSKNSFWSDRGSGSEDEDEEKTRCNGTPSSGIVPTNGNHAGPGAARPSPSFAKYFLATWTRLRKNFGLKFSRKKEYTLLFASDLPQASGLSSSSALVVAAFLAAADWVERGECTVTAFGQQCMEYFRNQPGDLAAYLGCCENGSVFKASAPFFAHDPSEVRRGAWGLAGSRGVGTCGGSEDHAAILGIGTPHFIYGGLLKARLTSDENRDLDLRKVERAREEQTAQNPLHSAAMEVDEDEEHERSEKEQQKSNNKSSTSRVSSAAGPPRGGVATRVEAEDVDVGVPAAGVSSPIDRDASAPSVADLSSSAASDNDVEQSKRTGGTRRGGRGGVADHVVGPLVRLGFSPSCAVLATVPWPAEQYVLVIASSGVEAAKAGGGTAQKRYNGAVFTAKKAVDAIRGRYWHASHPSKPLFPRGNANKKKQTTVGGGALENRVKNVNEEFLQPDGASGLADIVRRWERQIAAWRNKERLRGGTSLQRRAYLAFRQEWRNDVRDLLADEYFDFATPDPWKVSTVKKTFDGTRSRPAGTLRQFFDGEQDCEYVLAPLRERILQLKVELEVVNDVAEWFATVKELGDDLWVCANKEKDVADHAGGPRPSSSPTSGGVFAGVGVDPEDLRRGLEQELRQLLDTSMFAFARFLDEDIVPDEVKHLCAAATGKLGAVAASGFGAGYGGSVYAVVPAAQDAHGFACKWKSDFLENFPERTAAEFWVEKGPGMPARKLNVA